MKFIKKLIPKESKILLLTLVLVMSCKSDKKDSNDADFEYEEKIEDQPKYVEVVTNNMDFVMVDTLKSGWNTIKYINKSQEPHFILFDDYPDGKTIDTIKARVMPAFDKGMNYIMQNKMDSAMGAFGALPKWFPELKFVGGTGLISPGKTAITTLNLKPGNYIIECYVKMENGMFHASMGMAKEVFVKEENTEMVPPEANVKLTISSAKGITYNDSIPKGSNTFSVFFEDQIVHEHFLGHDVNLVKLNDMANMEDLESWMNWINPDGLKLPMPIGVTFLGGTNNGLPGSTHYFQADIEAGNYAFIAEVPNAKQKGMLKTFIVK